MRASGTRQGHGPSSEGRGQGRGARVFAATAARGTTTATPVAKKGQRGGPPASVERAAPAIGVALATPTSCVRGRHSGTGGRHRAVQGGA